MIRNLSFPFYISNKNRTKMEVMIVVAKSAIVEAQLGRFCLAHQSTDLYPASFGIKGISSNIFGITGLENLGELWGY